MRKNLSQPTAHRGKKTRIIENREIRVYHVPSEEAQLGAVEPLAALLTALQHLLSGGENSTGHPPRAHSLVGEERPRLAGLKHKH